eukprot:TRINITY_DN27470_c0_g1_i1.p1 TRINITY_DN27470_c0_g1~~TRINITY_DN27470_c0_g1_i1.p1  ORF type:complete len:674 (+),score=112.20 TRINITY_DN27470_c0_g1_i1:30-2024(+)
MEAGTLRSAKEGFCAQCYAKASLNCSKCKASWYCSAFCQAKDWNLGHKGNCGLGDLPPSASVPAPPARMLRESVERPVYSEGSWRRIQETIDLGPRLAPPRGLRNVGNSCYMNAVLQGLHHAVPVLQATLRHHCSGCSNRSSGGNAKPAKTAWGTAVASSGLSGCFRCDLETVSSTCMEPKPRTEGGDVKDDRPACPFALGDSVVLDGLKSEELNSQVGTVIQLPAEGTSEEEARVGVRLGSQGTKAIRPQNLQLYSKQPVGPHEVLRWLPRLSEEFTFGAQEDADEFLRSLLRLVEDEELKEKSESLQQSGETLEANADLTALPGRLFGGIQVSECRCTRRECAASSFNFSEFRDLTLEITEATDSLDDCLRLYTAAEKLDKKNGWKCDVCSEVVRARKQMTIYSPPRCLVLILKRFRFTETGRGKVTKPISFMPELNLRPYLCAGAPDEGRPLLYELRAVIVHLDKAGYSHFGHYIAYVRCAGERKGSSRWFRLDDSLSEQVDEKEVLRQQAYLLLYTQSSGGLAALPEGKDGAKRPQAAADTSLAALPSKCRGRGGAVCNFFACSDGLCTRCYQEEHGRPPPAPAPAAESGAPAASAPASSAAGGYPGAASAAAAKSGGKPANGKAAAAAAPPSGKAKKIGANDPCPCGSGKKYKKCHGAT